VQSDSLLAPLGRPSISAARQRLLPHQSRPRHRHQQSTLQAPPARPPRVRRTGCAPPHLGAVLGRRQVVPLLLVRVRAASRRPPRRGRSRGAPAGLRLGAARLRRIRKPGTVRCRRRACSRLALSEAWFCRTVVASDTRVLIAQRCVDRLCRSALRFVQATRAERYACASGVQCSTQGGSNYLQSHTVPDKAADLAPQSAATGAVTGSNAACQC